MNVAVIGLGSMGKRRVRLIKELYPSYDIVGIDARHDRREEANQQFQIQTFASLNEIENDCKCAFVCTQPLSHADIITTCLNRGLHVFTELNLVDNGYDRNIALADKHSLVLFISSTFLYREETQYIRNTITGITSRWNYVYHIGQYLPDWHPWESYKDFFVGDKRTNGCRELLSIELPWLIAAFGNIKSVNALSDKITNLDINYDDNFIIQLNHSNGNKGSLIVDVVSPYAVRNFEAYTEGAYISWGGNPKSLSVFQPETKELKNIELTENTEHREGYASFIVENAYKNEIRAFFDAVETGKKPLYDFQKDKTVLALIKEIGA